jgi:hypothetical protein
MFTSRDIQERLRERPFAPFQIVMTTGQTYDIFHPDLVLVGRHFIVVGTPVADIPALVDRVNHLALVHITELRALPATVSPTGNRPA